MASRRASLGGCSHPRSRGHLVVLRRPSPSLPLMRGHGLGGSAVAHFATHVPTARLKAARSRGGSHASCARRCLWPEAGRAHDEAALGRGREVCVKGTDVQAIAQDCCSEKFLKALRSQPCQPMRGAPEPKTSEEKHGRPRQRRTMPEPFGTATVLRPFPSLPFVLWPMPAVFGVLAPRRRPFGRRWTRVTSSRHAPPPRRCG